MKKIAALCVAAAFAFSAVPAFAQCASCGGNAPVFSQPVASSYAPAVNYNYAPAVNYAPQATYAAPVVSQPVYNSAPMPVYNSAPMPVYNSAPIVSAPVMGTVVNSAPVGGTIIGGGQIVGAPMMAGSACGGCCGGCAPMSGVVGTPMMSGTIVGGTPMAGQIVYETGMPLQGTIVSDVVVDSGEVTGEVVEGTVETGSKAEMVEPPAAEGSPEPDAESTEGDT